MTYKVSISAVIATFAVLVLLLLTPVVLAEEANQAEVETETTTSESFYEQKQQRLEALKQEAEKKREEAKKRAEQEVEAAKKNAEAKKEEVRIKNCETRLSALQNKISATSAAARRHQDKIDWFNDKIDAYVTKTGLAVQSSDALSAAAAASETAVSNLEKFETDINCTDIDAATQTVIAYKELLKEARSALSAYRAATKDWLVTVRTASETTQSDDGSGSESTSQDDTNTTEGAN